MKATTILAIISIILFAIGFWPFALLALIATMFFAFFSHQKEILKLKHEIEELKKQISNLTGTENTAPYEEPIRSRRSS